MSKIKAVENRVIEWKKICSEKQNTIAELKAELTKANHTILALTEQVEKLKESQGKQNVAIMNHLCDKTQLSDELSRLREERKELIGMLRDFCEAIRISDEKYTDWVGTSEVYDALFKSESLLSKFPEVPNE